LVVGKVKKPNISVVLPIQGYPKKKLKKGRRRKEGRKKTKKEDEPKVHAHVDVSGDCLWINFTSQE
jgi:hypothetical protein